MENNDLKNKPSEEIDLTQFFKWIGRGFNRAGNAILYATAATRNLFFQNLKFFAATIITGLCLGFIYYEFLNKNYYKTTMVLSCSYLNNQIVENTIKKLNTLCGEPERTGLANELGISDTLAKSIKGFEYKTFISEKDIVEIEVLKEQLNNLAADKKEVIEKVIKRIEIENKDAYQISVLVTKPGVVKLLEKALVDYFRNSEYIKKRLESADRTWKARHDKLKRETNKLDSLKGMIFNNIETLGKTSRGSNNVILGEENINNPLDVFQVDLQMNLEMLTIEENLYLRPNFEVVDGFTNFSKPENPGLLKILIIAFVLSFIAGYLIILGFKFDRMLANYPMK